MQPFRVYFYFSANKSEGAIVAGWAADIAIPSFADMVEYAKQIQKGLHEKLPGDKMGVMGVNYSRPYLMVAGKRGQGQVSDCRKIKSISEVKEGEIPLFDMFFVNDVFAAIITAPNDGNEDHNKMKAIGMGFLQEAQKAYNARQAGRH